MTPDMTSDSQRIESLDEAVTTAGRSTWISAAKALKWALLLAAIFGLWLFREPLTDFLALVANREALQAYLAPFGTAGILVIAFILTLQVIVAAIPGHALMLASGYIYGFLPSFLVVHISTVVASQFAYWLARRYGRPVVNRLASPAIVDIWTERAERQGMIFFFISFIVPIFPADVMNFVAGLSGLTPKKFLVANFFGRLATSIFFPLIGAQGFRLSPTLLIAGLSLTILILLGWRVATPLLEGQKSGK